jgi:hypothetical protein
VQGIIYNESGKPLKGAGIKLKLGARTLDYIYTDSKGHFAFENLKGGSYKVLVSGFFIGYSSRFFENVDIGTNEALEMKVILQPLKMQNETVVIYKNKDVYTDEFEDWSDISNRNKK